MPNGARPSTGTVITDYRYIHSFFNIADKILQDPIVFSGLMH